MDWPGKIPVSREAFVNSRKAAANISSRKDIESQMSDLKNTLALPQSKLMFYQEILKQPRSNNMTYLEEWHSLSSLGNSIANRQERVDFQK